jgi:hypothetical protein
VYLETVRFRSIMKFTALQAAYLCVVWAVTWAGAAGIAFPFLIVLLIPGRQYVMPRLFDKWTLSQLDAAEYEEAPPAPHWVVAEAARAEGATQRTAAETREALEAEMPGYIGIKHHVTQEEVSRRRLSLHQQELLRSSSSRERPAGTCAGAAHALSASPAVAGPAAVFGTRSLTAWR